MPKLKTTEKEFSELYSKVSKQTTQFKEIDVATLSENPHYIKIFRMLCGKSLTEIAKDLGKTHATISQYERHVIKKIPRTEAERIVSYLKDELPKNVSFDSAMENFKRFKELSNGGYAQAFKRAEKAELTNQEKRIEELLKNKSKKIEVHKTMETSIGPLNFDFWLPENKMVIECTESVSKHKAESLGFRIIKLKDRINCKTIVIIPKNVSNGVIRRLIDYDHIIFSSEIAKLENIIE